VNLLLNGEKLLEVHNLKTYFYTEKGVAEAIDGIDFEIFSGEVLGVVGESGCGKSVTALSIMRLIPEPPGKIVDGKIFLKGTNLLELKREEMRNIRGNNVSMIFQEPMTFLNPVYTVGDQISETILIHKHVSKKKAIEQSVEMLRKVGIPIPERRVNEYPHQLSGGMRQRIMIAMALACDPQLLIADEPTTALDVTIQAQILELMSELKDSYGMSIMMITHDLGVIAEMSNRVAVMYAGKIVEYADVNALFSNPKHPYTWALMKSIPRLDREEKKLLTIEGTVPSSYDFPIGCKFNNRCPLADNKCFKEEPDIVDVGNGHKVSCWHIDKLEELKKEDDFVKIQG
jgi:oligopeptide/dipeptide ABC transporter ATP-binding protein